MSDGAGRSCPLRYRYRPQSIAAAPEIEAQTLYVVGGLYGNLPALDTIESMASREPGPVTIVFNGDFNWFNVDDEGFLAVNRRVSLHHSIAGNVEAELCADDDTAGCGCAYPASVDQAVVERSNRIHARLKATASRHPDVLRQLAAMPMYGRYRVGGLRVGVVHGDAESLAGWRFDVSALADRRNDAWVIDAFNLAEADIFACSHTCLPALRCFEDSDCERIVINNGAAGMLNFSDRRCGVLTRIGMAPAKGRLYGSNLGGVHVDAVAIDYDHERWQACFLANWPEGSAAWVSYYDRIAHGPKFVQRAAVLGMCG